MKPMKSVIYGIGGLLALALVGCGGSSAEVEPPAPKPSISLAGAVTTPISFTSTDLKAKYTEGRQEVSYLSGTTPQNKTYLGVPLLDVVQDALADGNKTPGTTNTGNAGRLLIEHYVLSTATDGYQIVYSLGELSPSFGGSQPPNQPLIAYAQEESGKTVDLDDSTDGPFRITAPGDIKGGRYTSNAVKLEVGVPPVATPESGNKPGGQSTAVIINGNVTTATTFNVADLRALPLQTATYNGTTYKGAGLYDLLKTVGLKTSSRKNAELSMYAVATATDGFRTVVSLGEIHPDFGHRPAIVAYEREHDTDPTLGPTGALRLIIAKNPTTPETMGARQVSNLVEIQVFEAGTP